MSPKLPNLLAIAFAEPGPSQRVYTNKDIQEIICIVIEARFTAVKGPHECFLKAYFFDVYKNNNKIVCYNFCQQCKNYFAIARAKGLKHIFFVVSFLQD